MNEWFTVTRQIDNSSPCGAPGGKLAPGSHKRCKLGGSHWYDLLDTKMIAFFSRIVLQDSLVSTRTHSNSPYSPKSINYNIFMYICTYKSFLTNPIYLSLEISFFSIITDHESTKQAHREK